MPSAKAVVALLLCASVAAPSSAQVRMAAEAAGSSVPRLTVSAPLAAPTLSPLVSPSPLSAPPLSAPSSNAAPTASLPAAAAAPAASASPVPAALPAARALPAAARVAPALSSLAAPSERPRAFDRSAPAERGSWEKFWSGSAERSADDDAVPASAARAPASSPRLTRPSAGARLAGAAAAAVPAAHASASLWSHAAPYVEGGAVLAATYFVNRGAHWLLGKIAAKRGLDRHQIAAVRPVTSVALWTAAVAGALHFGGAPAQVTAAVFGAGGTVLTLGLKDVLGNVIQGVNFLVTRPFSIGDKVQVDDQAGTVSDVTLTGIVIRKDDGSEIKIRHAALAAKAVIVFGGYSMPDAKLHFGRLAVPQKPRFDGVAGAVWSSLGGQFWMAAGALAALIAVPHFVAFLSGGWAASAVGYALAGATAWLTHRIAAGLSAAVDKLAERNGWRPETRVITRLAVRAAAWAIGGGTVLRLLGVSWTALGASVGLTTLGVGLASNNFFGTVVQGGEVLFSKPFKVGDRLKIGAFEGPVEDMTLYHVVIKLDDGRYALVPYAVVRDATLVVTPGK